MKPAKQMRATLEAIRPTDGGQMYRYGPGVCDVEWLLGISRARDVKVGDTGNLVYLANKTVGIWMFEKDS